MIDFNDAERQQSPELIPSGTIAKARMTLQKSVEGFYIHESRNNPETKYLRAAFELSEHPHVGRKVYTYIGVEGDEEFVKMGKARIRAILESAKGFAHDDKSDEATEARHINSYEDLNGLTVQIKVSVRTDPTGKYPPKNDISKVITPDCGEYVRLQRFDVTVKF